MVFDSGRPVAGDVEPVPTPEPPHMISRPADAPPGIDRLSDSEVVRSFRAESAAQQAPRRGVPVRARFRRWAGRISGRADRRFMFAVAGATDVLIERCDSIADRLERQETLLAEVAESYGSELARLRAEVGHLRAAVPAENPHGG